MILYCRPPGFIVMLLEKQLAGGLQSGCTANLTGVQYKAYKKARMRWQPQEGEEKNGIQDYRRENGKLSGIHGAGGIRAGYH